MTRGTRAYLRLDPGFDEHKESYPDGPYAALITVFCLAESQPERGRFRNARFLRALMGRRGRHLPYLIEHGDIVEIEGGRLYVDGWDEWQEGDWKVQERLAKINGRHEAEDPSPTPGARRTANWRLRTRVFERDEFTCRYCGVTDYPREWLILEHVIPDGPSTEENLVTACRGCNKRKGGRTPEEAGMTLRDASRDNAGDASRDKPGDATGDAPLRLSGAVRCGSGAVPGEAPIPPPSGGSPRANGTNPRAIAAEFARRANAAEAERKAKRKARHVAYLDGRITEAQRVEMDERDAPLEEIPTERGAAFPQPMHEADLPPADAAAGENWFEPPGNTA